MTQVDNRFYRHVAPLCIGIGSYKDNCTERASHGYWCLRCEKLRMETLTGHKLLTGKEVADLLKDRNIARGKGDYKTADDIRVQLFNSGVKFDDLPNGSVQIKWDSYILEGN